MDPTNDQSVFNNLLGYYQDTEKSFKYWETKIHTRLS